MSGNALFTASVKSHQKFHQRTLARHCSSNPSVIDANCYKLLDSNDYQNINTMLKWGRRAASDLNYQVDFTSNHEFKNAIHYLDVEFDTYG